MWASRFSGSRGVELKLRESRVLGFLCFRVKAEGSGLRVWELTPRGWSLVVVSAKRDAFSIRYNIEAYIIATTIA